MSVILSNNPIPATKPSLWLALRVAVLDAAEVPTEFNVAMRLEALLSNLNHLALRPTYPIHLA